MSASQPSLRIRTGIAAALVLLTSAACARPTVAGHDSTSTASPSQWVPDSYRGMRLVGSIDEASSFLSFLPVAPAVGDPVRVFVTEEKADPVDEALLLIYDPPTGPFWVWERHDDPQVDDNFDQQIVDCAEGCDSKLSIVSVRDGIRALLRQAPEANVVKWRDIGIWWSVVGPDTSLSAEEAIELAKALY